jgi:ubiquinone/menaquinone biosynthesis C-methylase UbiE
MGDENSVSRSLKERHQIEQEFHDAKARDGVDDFYGYGALHEADEHLISALGELNGKRILEIGCGDGGTTVRFARSGAIVTAVDISGEMVELTKRRAASEGLQNAVIGIVAGVEDIEFQPESFDIVYGHSILHHLNLDIAVPRFVRALKPGGMAAFLEPLDYNPLLNAFRKFTPQRRTPTEKPLRFSQLLQVSGQFSKWDHREFYFSSLISFVWYYGIRNKSLFSLTMNLFSPIDRFIFRIFPFMTRYAWVTVLRYWK